MVGTGQAAVGEHGTWYRASSGRRMYRRLVPLSRMLHNGVGVEGRRAGRKAGIYGHANAQRRQVSRCSVYPRHAWGVLRMYGTKQFGASVRPQPLLQPHSVAAARHVVRHGGQEAERGVDGPRRGGLAGKWWRRLRSIGHTVPYVVTYWRAPMLHRRQVVSPAGGMPSCQHSAYASVHAPPAPQRGHGSAHRLAAQPRRVAAATRAPPG